MQAIDYVIRDGAGNLSRGSLDAQTGNVKLDVEALDAVSLKLGRDDVHDYRRVGDNLVIELEGGREIVLENMFGEGIETNTRLFFSESGEIYEISFSESWGRTNYAHYSEGGADGMIFADAAVSDVAAVATTTTTDVTMAAAPIFAGLGGAAGGAGIAAGVALASLGVAAAAGGGGGGGGNGGGGGGGSTPLATNGNITIMTAGAGADQIINGAEHAAGPTVTGNTYANSLVTVTFDGTILTTTSDANGDYTVAFNPADILAGEHTTTVTASVVAPDGSTQSTSASVEVDTVSHVDIDTASVEGDGVILASETADGIVVSGTSEPGANVVVTFEGVSRAATVAGDGTWSVTYNGTTAAGINGVTTPITAEATDLAGNVVTVTENVTVDTVLNVSIDDIQVGDNVINRGEAQAGVTFTGTTDPGAWVTLELNGLTVNAVVDANGNWTADFPSSGLPASDVTLTMVAHANDASGNATSTSHDIVIDNLGMVSIDAAPIEIDDIVNAAEQLDGVTLTGTTTPGSTVVVHFHSFTGNATVDAAGNWTVDVPAGNIDLGTYPVTVTATATTPTGNVSTASDSVQIDTLVDALSLTNNAVTGDNFINSAEYDAGFVLSGTVEPGSVVNVTIGGVTKAAVVDAAGNWSTTIMPGEVPDGEYQTTVTAEATDAAGNTRTISQSVFVDTVANNLVLSGVPIEGDNVVNANEASDGFEVNGSGDPGVDVTVTFNGNTYNTTTDANGDWTIFVDPTDIGPGDFNGPLIVETSDAAGNVTTDTTNLSIDLEVSNVTMPDPNTVAGDGYINGAEATAGVPLAGTAEPGSTVIIAVGNTDYPATVDANGNWTVTIDHTAFITGEYDVDISATITDLAGNTVVETINVDVDTHVNDLSVTSTSMDGVSVLNSFAAQQGINMQGTVEPGSTVMVTFETTVKAANVDAAGNWTVTFAGAEVPTGEYTTHAQIVATDVAGNTATTTSSFTMDTSIPESPEITAITYGTSGVRGIALEHSTDQYTVNALTDAETTYAVSSTVYHDTSRNELAFNFHSDQAAGTDLIVNVDDDAGNSSATLFVFDNNDNPVVSMDNAGLDSFSIEAVDLVFAANAELIITEQQLEDLSDLSDSLLIRGGGDDTVTAIGATQTNQTQVIEGEVYDTYTMGTDGAFFMVDQDVDVIT